MPHCTGYLISNDAPIQLLMDPVIFTCLKDSIHDLLHAEGSPAPTPPRLEDRELVKARINPRQGHIRRYVGEVRRYVGHRRWDH